MTIIATVYFFLQELAQKEQKRFEQRVALHHATAS